MIIPSTTWIPSGSICGIIVESGLRVLVRCLKMVTGCRVRNFFPGTKSTLLKTGIEKDEEANNLLGLFNGTDAWRRPERFSHILSAFTPYAHTQSKDWGHRKQVIINALKAANSVDVQDIIARGFKGPQIREALNTEKLAVIEGVINVQPHE